MRKLILGLLALALSSEALAQEEVIVTAMRRTSYASDDDESGPASRIPAIGLKRTADFAVWFVNITGDTRDGQKRRDEVYAMLKNAIEIAGRRGGIELGTGTSVVEPLTLANYRNVPLVNAGRIDTDRVNFIVKTRLGGGIDAKAALDKVEAFIKSVPAVGRAELTRDNDLTLSVVDPDQYRGAVADLVAADARTYAAKIGANYGVEVKGLDRKIEWTRASLTEVMLYLPYSYVIMPAK
jgi:hypothetical protein